MTDAAPNPLAHPLIVCLTQIVEALCQAIDAQNGRGVVTRLMAWQLRRWLRKLTAQLAPALARADAIAAGAAERPAMIPGAPPEAVADAMPLEITADTRQDSSQDTSQDTSQDLGQPAAQDGDQYRAPPGPAVPAAPADQALSQDGSPAALPTAQARDDGPGGACATPDEPVAPATRDGRRGTPAPYSAPYPAASAPAVAARRSAVPAAHRPPDFQKAPGAMGIRAR